MDGNLTVHNGILIQVPAARDVKYSCKYPDSVLECSVV